MFYKKKYSLGLNPSYYTQFQLPDGQLLKSTTSFVYLLTYSNQTGKEGSTPSGDRKSLSIAYSDKYNTKYKNHPH